jgi:sigma-B regulation protein RsbU (phosphoserine phosphatase)
MAPGAILVLKPDGVTEAFDAAGEMFGEERLPEVVAGQPQASAADRVDAIAAAVRDHAGTAPQSDDITVLVLRID